MRVLIIRDNDASQRVDKFLSKTFPTMPKSLMYKYIRNKKIKVNGKRCEISQRLSCGDEISCYIAQEFFDTKKDDSFLKIKQYPDILYEDENILIMNKEVGLLAHNDDQNKEIDTLVNRMKRYLYDKGEYDYNEELSFTPALCHRIDRNTQGIVIGAKHAKALRDMNEAIRNHCLSKQYLCIAEGIFECKNAILKAYHKKEKGQVDICSVMKVGYKEIVTEYEVVKEKGSLSLLKVILHTGRSHQIRAFMAYLKHPLYGDIRYGAKKRVYAYQALCAYKVSFDRMPESLSYLNQKSFEIKDIDFMSIIK